METGVAATWVRTSSILVAIAQQLEYAGRTPQKCARGREVKRVLDLSKSMLKCHKGELLEVSKLKRAKHLQVWDSILLNGEILRI